MRHRVANRKLGRTTAHRMSMLANMTSSLVIHDRIETTLPKAKELKRMADRMVTLGKRGTVAARRRAIAIIRDKKAVKKIFDELAPRYAGRNGGYTRIYKLGNRHGDCAEMAMIEYVDTEAKQAAKVTKPGKKKAEPKKKAAPKKTESKKTAKKPAAKKPAKKAAPKKAASKKAAPKKTAKKASAKKSEK